MKRTLTIIILALVAMTIIPADLFGQAQIYTRKEKLKDITTKTVKVVMTGDEILDEALKQSVTSTWTMSPFEFCTQEEFNKIKSDSKFYFLIVVKGQQRKESEPGIDLLTMVNLTNGAVQREALRARGVPDERIMARIQPFEIDTHTIGNASGSYAYYLVNMILSAILAMSVVLVTIYSVGAELKYGTSTELLETAGDSVGTALLGKLLPYTVLFALLGSLLELLLFGWAGYPIKGSVGWMILAVTVMVLAYQSVAVFIISMVPTLRLSISIGSLYSVLGITFAGFTLPLTALPPALQGLSVIFPLRFYYQIYTREVIYGSGFAGWWVYLVCLLVFLILPYLSSHRLYNAYKYQNYPKD